MPAAGKSLCAVNLAYHLKEITGRSIGLIDADVDSSNLAEFIGPIGTIEVTPDKRFKLLEWNGIKVWSMSLVTEKWRPISLTGDKYAAILNDVVHYSDLDVDYLVIDFPAGAMDVFRGAIYIFAESFIGDVVVIQPAFIDNARRVLKLHQVNEVPVIGLIENMSYLLCSKCGETYHVFGESIGGSLAKEFGMEFLGSIPLIPDLHERLVKGDPVLKGDHSAPFKRAAEIIKDLPEEKVGLVKRIKEVVVDLVKPEVERIFAFIISTVNKEIGLPPDAKFDEKSTVDLVVLDSKRRKVITRWHLGVRDRKLCYIKSPTRVDFELETTFRTLARVIMGKRKTREGKIIDYDGWDAWLNNDFEIVARQGGAVTQRSVSVLRDVFFNPKVMSMARERFKSLEKYI